jgi:hypothetical protein
MTNKKNESKLTLSKVSISNLEALDPSQQRKINGGGTETCPDQTFVPINCQP